MIINEITLSVNELISLDTYYSKYNKKGLRENKEGEGRERQLVVIQTCWQLDQMIQLFMCRCYTTNRHTIPNSLISLQAMFKYIDIVAGPSF